jgi:hypothetical protein
MSISASIIHRLAHLVYINLPHCQQVSLPRCFGHSYGGPGSYDLLCVGHALPCRIGNPLRTLQHSYSSKPNSFINFWCLTFDSHDGIEVSSDTPEGV